MEQMVNERSSCYSFAGNIFLLRKQPHWGLFFSVNRGLPLQCR